MEYGSRLGACYLHTAVSIDFAQAAVAPSPVGIEVVADFKLVSRETPFHFFGGNALLAAISPRATGRRLYLYSVCFHGDGVGVSLVRLEIAGDICFGSIGKVFSADVYPDKRLALHVLRHHDCLVFLRCDIVIRCNLAVGLVCRFHHTTAEVGFRVTEKGNGCTHYLLLRDAVARRERDFYFRHTVVEI